MKNRVGIFSHRGLGFGEEENSIKSYDKAMKEGFSIEIDVQKTKDDVLVISHDSNLKRVKGIDREICDSYFAELREFIPSFEEIITILKNYGGLSQIAIHVKDETQGNLLGILCEKIKEEKLEDRCLIFDVTKDGRDIIRALAPNIRIAFSVGEERYSNTIYLWEDLLLEDFDIVWWDEWTKEAIYNKENFEKIKKEGKEIYVISPELHKDHAHPASKDPSKIRGLWEKLISWGVDGICTDYPHELDSMLNN
jgi:glycerophosphoryl diester phosphodiesterase